LHLLIDFIILRKNFPVVTRIMEVKMLKNSDVHIVVH